VRYLSGSPRRVLSKIVQLRAGHARLRQHYVGRWAPPEAPLCDCEALTIDHILIESALSEDATEELRRWSHGDIRQALGTQQGVYE
jgi:hypothetical protein